MATRRFRFGPTVIWANSSSTATFHPTSPPMEAGGFDTARCTIRLEQDTGAIRAQAAYRYSNDQDTWDTPAGRGNEQNGNGTTYGEAMGSISSGKKRYIQLGVLAINDTGVDVLHLGRTWTDWEVGD